MTRHPCLSHTTFPPEPRNLQMKAWLHGFWLPTFFCVSDCLQACSFGIREGAAPGRWQPRPFPRQGSLQSTCRLPLCRQLPRPKQLPPRAAPAAAASAARGASAAQEPGARRPSAVPAPARDRSMRVRHVRGALLSSEVQGQLWHCASIIAGRSLAPCTASSGERKCKHHTIFSAIVQRC